MALDYLFPFSSYSNCFDFSVHPENEIEYLIESNCLRQEKEEIVVLKKMFIAEQ